MPKTAAKRDIADANLWSEYDIEATTSLVDKPLRTLKHGDAFAVLDSHGDIGSTKETAEGLYYRDTRYLSHFELRFERERPLLLSSTMHENKAALSVDLTKPDVLGPEGKLARDTVFLQRTKFLWQGVCYERVSIRSYDLAPRRLGLTFRFDADFRDLFEIRGTPRPRRGSPVTTRIGSSDMEFRYRGLDGLERRTVLRFDPAPERIAANAAAFTVDLPPGGQTTIVVTVSCEEATRRPVGDFFLAYRDSRRARRESTAGIATVTSSNEIFDEVACRATSDVYTLITRTELGKYPYAGIPWFSTVFGRDGIITALLMLWVDASVARGVLRTLAECQATTTDPKADAQPGKILHERRHGEISNLS